MKKYLCSLSIAAISTLALSACANYEGVEPAKFAAASCGAFNTLYESETALVDTLSSFTEGSDEVKTQLAQTGADMVKALTDAKATVIANQPSVKEGTEIVAEFSQYFDVRIESANAAITTFQGSDPSGDANEFLDQAITLAEGISDSDEYEFPFAAIENQKVVDAVDKEPTCDEIVEVY